MMTFDSVRTQGTAKTTTEGSGAVKEIGGCAGQEELPQSQGQTE